MKNICCILKLFIFYLGWEEDFMEQIILPKCQKCKGGDLCPFRFWSQGAAIHYKAWVCTNPDCGFNLKIRNGDVYLNEPIMSGALHNSRTH